MNIKENLPLNDQKPAVLAIRRTDKRNITAIGLKKDQTLKDHKTSHVTTLIVLQGGVDFVIGDKVERLQALDVFEVPVETYHKVVAREESIFVLVQEKLI